MIKHIGSTLLFALFALAFQGCKSSSPSGPSTSSPSNAIFPLTVGNSWTVRITDPQQPSRPAIDSIVVLSDTLITGETWHSVRFVASLGPVHDYFINRAIGLYEFITGNSPQTTLWLKYPAVAGDTSSEWLYRWTVLSTVDTVVVPAGSFVCYHYAYYFGDTWFAPNVGFVKSTDQFGTIELLSYHLK